MLLLFSVVNIFVLKFKYNLYLDIFNDISAYLTKCGSVVETASNHVCYCSVLSHIPVKSRYCRKTTCCMLCFIIFLLHNKSDIVFKSNMGCIFQLNWRRYRLMSENDLRYGCGFSYP